MWRYLRKIAIAAAWTAAVPVALVFFLAFWAMSGYGPRVSGTDITREKPYADYIGREYRVVGDVSAYAWNDFPDTEKILSITLTPPPGTRNRFVSYVIPLERGQRIRIIGAIRQFALFETVIKYVVSVPDTELPNTVQVWNATLGSAIPRFFRAASSTAAGLDVRNVLFLGPGSTMPGGLGNVQATAAFFVNTAAHDYRLAAGSPAIEGGVSIGSVAKDRVGVARPQGAYWDVGAYQYVH